MEIRVATANDVEGLCPLLTEFFAYNAKLQPRYCNAAVEDGEYPKGVIESVDSDFLVAKVDGDIVGFIHINKMKTPPYSAVASHDYAEIIAFMVTASHREKGVGSKLIDFAKTWSFERNLDYIELFSLVNANEANEFYDKKDFITEAHIRRYQL